MAIVGMLDHFGSSVWRTIGMEALGVNCWLVTPKGDVCKCVDVHERVIFWLKQWGMAIVGMLDHFGSSVRRSVGVDAHSVSCWLVTTEGNVCTCFNVK
jgi:hypothetical protein